MARTARLAHPRLIPAVGAALALLLAGCGAGQISQTAQQVAAVDGASGYAGFLGVRDVRLAGTEELSYEAGADVPVEMWISNAATTPDTLSGVSSPAADSVKISGTAVIQGQTLLEVNKDSALTVTLTGVKNTIPYGHSIPMTFTFAQSGSFTVNVPIAIPEERSSEERPTVDILPPEHGNIWFGEEGSEGTDGSGSAEAGH